jgi:hypothetical protein
MKLGIRRSFKILAPGNSLRRLFAYSLALAGLILAPAIFLAVYYLFRMSFGPALTCGANAAQCRAEPNIKMTTII